ncbi:hypothetical protein AB1Y20_001942 [Prymnesium parvum]|uniref:EF-hand domain-containing protein n=1 Tax=Prymnesium parvum TaxID=97485 RepID=A0AB34JA46_PRYPA
MRASPSSEWRTRALLDWQAHLPPYDVPLLPPRSPGLTLDRSWRRAAAARLPHRTAPPSPSGRPKLSPAAAGATYRPGSAGSAMLPNHHHPLSVLQRGPRLAHARSTPQLRPASAGASAAAFQQLSLQGSPQPAAAASGSPGRAPRRRSVSPSAGVRREEFSSPPPAPPAAEPRPPVRVETLLCLLSTAARPPAARSPAGASEAASPLRPTPLLLPHESRHPSLGDLIDELRRPAANLSFGSSRSSPSPQLSPQKAEAERRLRAAGRWASPPSPASAAASAATFPCGRQVSDGWGSPTAAKRSASSATHAPRFRAVAPGEPPRSPAPPAAPPAAKARSAPCAPRPHARQSSTGRFVDAMTAMIEAAPPGLQGEARRRRERAAVALQAAQRGRAARARRAEAAAAGERWRRLVSPRAAADADADGAAAAAAVEERAAGGGMQEEEEVGAAGEARGGGVEGGEGGCEARAEAAEAARGEARAAEERAPPRRRSSAIARPAAETRLVLTARPEGGTAEGLEDAVREARDCGLIGPRAARLVADALAKLEEIAGEYGRAAQARGARLQAFAADAAVRELREQLVELVAPRAVGIGRTHFLDLHLALSREGVFDEDEVGDEVGSYPYCWSAPAYLRFASIRKNSGGRRLSLRMLDEAQPTGSHLPRRASMLAMSEAVHAEHAAPSSSDEEGEYAVSMYASSKSARYVPWDEGLQLWKMLLSRGGVHDHVLSADTLTEALFEIADATLANRTSFAEGDVEVRVEDYRAILGSLVRSIQQQPKAGKAVLKHCWPPFSAHLSEVRRRLSLLQQALTGSFGGKINKEVAAAEFEQYCELVGVQGWKLTYSQMDRALHKMDTDEYRDLMFRHAVIAREGSSTRALMQAVVLDTDQMFCFLRFLDEDCDGFISQRDFCRVVMAIGTNNHVSASEMELLRHRWLEAEQKLANAVAPRNRVDLAPSPWSDDAEVEPPK